MSTPYDAPYKERQREGRRRVKHRGRTLYSHPNIPAKRIVDKEGVVGYVPWGSR